MSPSEAARLLGVVKSYWPNFGGDKAAIVAWADALADVAYADAEAAVREFGRGDREFAPSPGQVRARVKAAAGPACWVCGRRGSHVHDRIPDRPRRRALPPTSGATSPAPLTEAEAIERQRAMVAALVGSTE